MRSTTLLLTAALCVTASRGAAAQTIQVYDIPAGPLPTALLRLASVSGRNILFDATSLASRRSRAVRGASGFDAALTVMLRGTGVGFETRTDGSVIVRPDVPAGHRDRAAGRAAGPTSAAAADGAAGGTVVVTGRRDANSAAEKMAANTVVDVLSAQELARHPDTNVAESLARLPGVNVMFSTISQASSQGNGSNYGGVDTAARGEGQFVSVRGLNGEYNLNLINGIDVAQGMPYSREVQLSLLPPTGIESIVVSKTSTADMQGDAIGGTIDFRMPTAFDHPGTHVSLYADSRYEEKAADYGLNPWGYEAQLSASKTFGADDRFGVYASGYYSLRHFANSEQTNGQFEYKIVDANKAVPAGVNAADDLQLLGFGMQMTRGSTKRYGGTASFDWKVSDAVQAFVRGTYAQSDTEQTVYQIGIQGDRGGFASAVPLGGTSGYSRVVSNEQELHYWAQSNPGRDTLGTAVAGFHATMGRLSVTPQAYYTWGANDFPDHFEVTFYNRALSPTGNDADTNYQDFRTGVGIGYRAGYPIPIFTPGIASNVANIANWRARNRGEITDGRSDQHKYGFKLDAAYDVGAGWFDTLKFGGKYTDARRYTSFRDIETDVAIPAGTTLGGSGLVDVTIPAVNPGVYNYALPLVDPDRFRAAYAANGGFAATFSPDDYNRNTVSGTERVASGYLLAELKLGPVAVTPGIRFEHTDIDDRFWIAGNDGVDQVVRARDGTTQVQHFGWATSQSHFDEFLPSINAAWRPNPRSVYRAAVWTSYTRPPFIQLAGNTSTTVNADGDVSISRGNPDLKPIRALNVDASGDWTTNFGTILSAAGYYKHLSNFIFDSGGNYSHLDTATNTRVTVSQPVNGGSGHVLGLELGLRQNFIMLPGALAGLAVAGNATFQHSEVNLETPGLDPHEHLQAAPHQLYNASLIYERARVIADLSYHYSSDYILSYGLFGTSNFGSSLNSSALDEWVHARGEFDLSAAYQLQRRLLLRFAVQNLTGTRLYQDTIGRYSPAVPQIIDAGRSFVLSVRFDLR